MQLFSTYACFESHYIVSSNQQNIYRGDKQNQVNLNQLRKRSNQMIHETEFRLSFY